MCSGQTYRRQLGDNYCYGGKAVDKEICQAVIGIVGADKEQHNGDTEKELLGRGILVTVVDLLPHVEVVIGTRVEVKGDTADIVEHEVGAGHVREIDEGPGCFLGHAWDDIKQDLAEEDEDKVDSPCTCESQPRGRIVHGCDGSPFALTHSTLRLGSADWSLSCSSDSGGSL